MRPFPGQFRRILADTPVPWALGGFLLYFWYAQFATVAWNTIELIIAQHLLFHGTYATSLDYPSAVTWRPVLPTFVVTFVRIWTSNPFLIFRIVTGATFAVLTASTFWSGKIMAGRRAAHLAAGLTLLCPGLTVYLITHPHSYSNLVGLMMLGPAMALSLFLLTALIEHREIRAGWYLATGLAWGLSYLSRSEFVLFFAWHFAVLAWLHWRNRKNWRPLLVYVAAFAVCFVSYNVFAEHAANRDGILFRKSIYGFYLSQGWADPPPGVSADIESDGYQYAIQLYGDPVANHESALRAVTHNPSAFFHRVLRNFRAFYSRYNDLLFFPLVWTICAVGAIGLLPAKSTSFRDRVLLVFLLGLFGASHFVLIFHIDSRYLTINLPPLILFMAYGASRLDTALVSRPVVWRASAMAAWLILIVTSSHVTWRGWQEPAEPNTRSMIALRSLGRHFTATIPHPVLAGNREPHLLLVYSKESPLAPEDHFLLGYFSKTSWHNDGAAGATPRGKFYSFRDCPIDYMYVPAERVQEGKLLGKGTIVTSYDNPVLGRYYLVQMNPDPEAR